MPEIHALILAAGKGTRMKSELPKVIHNVIDKPMLSYVVEAVQKVGAQNITVVTGFKAELVEAAMSDYKLNYTLQKEQMGTGHAVQCYIDSTEQRPQHLLVVCGDTPLISVETLECLVATHITHKPAITMMTLEMQQPGNYGRIIRSNGEIVAIREAKDCTEAQLSIKEVNLAIYLFDADFLFENIFKLSNSNNQKEYYLTDMVEIAIKQNKKILSVLEKDESSTLGINSRQHLAQVTAILKKQIIDKLMSNGVTIVDPAQALIGADVQIMPDTIIHPGTQILGKTKIGSNCVIGPNAYICDSTISSGSSVFYSVIKNSSISSDSDLKPFSVIEPS